MIKYALICFFSMFFLFVNSSQGGELPKLQKKLVKQLVFDAVGQHKCVTLFKEYNILHSTAGYIPRQMNTNISFPYEPPSEFNLLFDGKAEVGGRRGVTIRMLQKLSKAGVYRQTTPQFLKDVYFPSEGPAGRQAHTRTGTAFNLIYNEAFFSNPNALSNDKFSIDFGSWGKFEVVSIDQVQNMPLVPNIESYRIGLFKYKFDWNPDCLKFYSVALPTYGTYSSDRRGYGIFEFDKFERVWKLQDYDFFNASDRFNFGVIGKKIRRICCSE